MIAESQPSLVIRVLQGLFKDIILKLTSLLLAVLLYLHVQSIGSQVTQSVFTVNLTRRNLDSDLFVTRMPETVSLVAEGTPEEIRRIDTRLVLAYVDLYNAEPGRKRYLVNFFAPTDLRVKWERRTRFVEIDIEQNVRLEKPVEIETMGVPPPELVYDGAAAQPALVMIEGPQSVMKQVARARVLVDLSKLRPGVPNKAVVEIFGKGNKPLGNVLPNPREVNILPAITAAPSSKQVLVTPDWVGQPAFGYRVRDVVVTPNMIAIEGASSALSRTMMLKTEPVDINGLQSSTRKMVKVVLPKGLRFKGGTRVEVRVEVEPVPTPTIPQPINP